MVFIDLEKAYDAIQGIWYGTADGLIEYHTETRINIVRLIPLAKHQNLLSTWNLDISLGSCATSHYLPEPELFSMIVFVCFVSEQITSS